MVDDSSREPIAGQLQDGLRGYPQVKFYRNEVNLGMVRNWNACISHASGQWMGILCDDDCYREGATERAVAIMKNTSKHSLILQDTSLNEDMVCCAAGRETLRTLRLPIVSGNFWHRKIVDEMGGFDERFIYSADAEYWYRIAGRFPVVKVKTPFAVYKRHEKNYMWATWRKPDFLEQTEALGRRVASYAYDDQKTIEKMTDNGLWSTLLTIIEAAFLAKGMSDIFARYFPEAWKRSAGFKRKVCLAKAFMGAGASRFKSFSRTLFGGISR